MTETHHRIPLRAVGPDRTPLPPPSADPGVLMLRGWRVHTSVYLTEPGQPVTVRRPWRARLFSRPWRPWVGHTIVIPQVPATRAYRIGDRTLVIHPAHLETLKRHLSEVPWAERRKRPRP